MRAQWKAEAEAAIRLIEPNSEVVDAVRRPLVMGQYGMLIARLADKSEWAISPGLARRLDDRQVADLAARDESFGVVLADREPDAGAWVEEEE